MADRQTFRTSTRMIMVGLLSFAMERSPFEVFRGGFKTRNSSSFLPELVYLVNLLAVDK
jgi:hypothetical protein